METPAFDARLLIEAGAGVTRTDILTDPYRALDARQLKEIDAFIARRSTREPVAHILGRQAFWKHDFTVTPDVLIPRPETELLVEQALAMLPAAQDGATLSALDLGVGSGAILISLIKARGDLSGVGVDCSARALVVARFNAAALDAGERITL
ncbi:MAG: class I SAM-dependent methyltransferase, partial [Hyphomonadaceae bacterium]